MDETTTVRERDLRKLRRMLQDEYEYDGFIEQLLLDNQLDLFVIMARKRHYRSLAVKYMSKTSTLKIILKLGGNIDDWLWQPLVEAADKQINSPESAIKIAKPILEASRDVNAELYGYILEIKSTYVKDE